MWINNTKTNFIIIQTHFRKEFKTLVLYPMETITVEISHPLTTPSGREYNSFFTHLSGKVLTLVAG